MDKKERSRRVIELLKKTYSGAKIALTFNDVFQLLVVVILSAQCTDERVNKVSPPLFKRFQSIEDFANCDREELEKYVFSTGFYKNKAKNIVGAAKVILEKFSGRIPNTMCELLTLPGVARKTANVVLSDGFNKNEGIVVDTHVIRLSGLLGLVSRKLSESKNAVKIERELIKLVPKKNWGIFPHLIIHHGRKICIAGRPRCKDCVLNKICPSAS
ncbi:MAG: endonuclease III [Candidatus Curtissbacteria bacterium]|nr:endonuclease III [Candidatus Curtissbacteria bacterium]